MDYTKQNRDSKSLQPIAQKAYGLFMQECEKQGLKVLITETLRTKERQYYLACQGRTVSQAKAMGVPNDFATKYCNPSAKQVTWTLNSNHLDGWAFDFCQNIRGKEYEDAFMKKGGKIVSELGLEWGGAFGDSPHVQVPKGWKEPVMEKQTSKIKINLNGVVKEVEAVNIDGNNYVKLQDIRDEKIVVEYDGIPIVKVK
ncbi:MAG: M15 family metallopeptidase [Sarcina sp.]